MPIAIGKILYTKLYWNEEEIKNFHESDPRFKIWKDKQILDKEQEALSKEIEEFLKSKL